MPYKSIPTYRIGNVWELYNAAGSLFELNDGHKRSVVGHANAEGIPAGEAVTQQLIGADGIRYNGMQFGERTIAIDMVVVGKTHADARSIKQQLVNFIRPRQASALTLRHTTSDGNQQREIEVYYSSGLELSAETQRANGLQFTVNLTAYDNPFWRGRDQVSVALDAVATGTGFGFPFGFSFGFTLSGFASKTINYNGNVAVNPIIEVTGPFNTLQILHQELNRTLYVQSPLAVGETLTIDLSPGGISALSSTGTNYINALANSELVDFVITPNSDNTIIADGTGTDSNTTVTLKYYERYLTL